MDGGFVAVETGLLAQVPCKSFRQFVEMHETAVFTFCYRLLGSAAVAEDVAEAAFEEVYARFPAVSLVDVLAAARRRCRQRRRERWAGPETAVADIQCLFNGLTVSECEVMALRYGCRLNFEEIATVLGLSAEDVRATLRQGRWRVANLEMARLAGQN
ncbi:MAG: hypothetical protein H6659_18715 [Ardenticatenaceae bacterium]|nr:hypothetical protein [Ardenticatenaceae bacterium]MCB8987122.1 hypothetical protein [Ardenticatenaceae bacterium]